MNLRVPSNKRRSRRIWILYCLGILVVCLASYSQADSNVVVSNTGEIEIPRKDENPSIQEAVANETSDGVEYDDDDDDDDDGDEYDEDSVEFEQSSSFLNYDNHEKDEAFREVDSKNANDETDDEEDDDEDEWDSPMFSTDEADSENEFAAEASLPNPPGVDEGSDLGLPQKYYSKYIDETSQRIQQARKYMQETVMVDSFYSPVQKICVNKDAECTIWAALGECDKNSGFMKTHCAPMCESCEMMHVVTRCPPPDPDGKVAMYPGDLNRMFHRLLDDPAFAQYTPTVLSRPDYAEGDTPETADYALGMWLVLLENVVNEDEANRMIELAHHQGFERSEDVGEELEDGTFAGDVNEDRTSTNAWCEEECYDDPVPQKVMKVIEHVTGIPEPNQESLQQLKYEVGQLYNVHNDFIEYQVDRPGGPRIL